MPAPTAIGLGCAWGGAHGCSTRLAHGGPAQFVTVTVQSGDTLLGLALAHGVPMAAIQLQNDLGNSTIVQLGQSLVIPPPSAWAGASPTGSSTR